MFLFFQEIFFTDNIIITFSVHPFNICEKFPILWFVLKVLFITTFFTNSYILFFYLFRLLPNSRKRYKNIISESSDFNLVLGYNENNSLIRINQNNLYKNILITGSIGSGKTSSAIYPFITQLIEYHSYNIYDKIGMLILDVKGNLFRFVSNIAIAADRYADLIEIGLDSNVRYNPLDKPDLSPYVLADRLKTILLLFSPNNTEDFWLDKVSQVLAEAIKFCRLYNEYYVTFEELHNLIFSKEYYLSKAEIVKRNFINNLYSKSSTYDLYSSLSFFENEFFKLDDRTVSIIKSEISRITSLFVSDYNVKKIFCPPKKEINFHGFSEVINQGKIVTLNMNIAKYKNISKVIAAYLKLDFQAEVIARLSNSDFYSSASDIFSTVSKRSVCFLCDEYQEYVTSSDANFFSQSREAKCINIVATQSYSSLLDTLNKTSSLKVIIQNLVNKLWFRNDDLFTIEEAQKLIGKEEKEKKSRTISENAKESNYNYLFKLFLSKNSSLSESVNSYFQKDYIYDTNFFTSNLQTFSCLAFLSDDSNKLIAQKINLIPYFKK